MVFYLRCKDETYGCWNASREGVIFVMFTKQMIGYYPIRIATRCGRENVSFKMLKWIKRFIFLRAVG